MLLISNTRAEHADCADDQDIDGMLAVIDAADAAIQCEIQQDAATTAIKPTGTVVSTVINCDINGCVLIYDW